MARIFITGSTDGLGRRVAEILIGDGHEVVLHARNEERRKDVMSTVQGVAVLVADLSLVAEIKELAATVNNIGPFDAILHNAGVGYHGRIRGNTTEGLPPLFVVNTLAPYILTCLVKKPGRLLYISSGLHTHGDSSLQDLTWDKRLWSGYKAYADSKLHDLILALAVARKWSDVLSNAINPGWIATKMGGGRAPDSLTKGSQTQVWLAVSDDDAAQVSGKYFQHMRQKYFLNAASNEDIQDQLLANCAQISGVSFPP